MLGEKRGKRASHRSDLETMRDEERLLAKETKPVLERKKLSAEIAKLHAEQKAAVYQNSKLARLIAGFVSLLPVLATLSVGILTWTVGRQTATIQQSQEDASLEAEQLHEFDAAFGDATQSNEGDLRRIDGIYSISKYWSTQSPPAGLTLDAARARSSIVSGEQDRIINMLTAILFDDKVSKNVRQAASAAIGRAFEGDDHAEEKERIAKTLFGTVSTSGHFSYGTITGANSYIHNEWNIYAQNHLHASTFAVDPKYDDKINATVTAIIAGKSYLENADFDDCDLTYAQLGHVNLQGASIVSADLTGAQLSNVDLKNVDLTQSLLIHADVTGTDFTGAKIDSVDFTGARVKGAIFADVTGVPAHFKTLTDFLRWAKSQAAIGVSAQ